VLIVMAKYENISKYVHLPVQSGNSNVLKRMNRGYTREWYLNRIAAIRRYMPDAAISTDVITGFCSETEEEHQDTMSLMAEVCYDMAYMFKYSERPKTLAERKYEDDISEETKSRRLTEIIDQQMQNAAKCTKQYVGRVQRILIEGTSKKSAEHFQGRNSQNLVVVFPKTDRYQLGQYVMVKMIDCTSVTLIGEVVEQS